MHQHCNKRHQHYDPIDGEKQQLEGSVRQAILHQLWQCDSVQKNDPHHVDDKHESQGGVAEGFQFLPDFLARLLQMNGDWFQFPAQDLFPEFCFVFFVVVVVVVIVVNGGRLDAA